MIRGIVRQAWAQSPVLVILSVPAAIAFLYLVRLLLVVAIVAGTPAAA